MAIQDRLGLNKNVSGGAKNKMDARNKLVQIKRHNIKDARERLGEITKEQGDVRSKLNKTGRKQRQNVAEPLLSKQIPFSPSVYKNLSSGLKNKIISHVEATRLANQKRTEQQTKRTNAAARAPLNRESITRTVTTFSQNNVRNVKPAAKIRDGKSESKFRDAGRLGKGSKAPARPVARESITTKKSENPAVVRVKPKPRVAPKEQRGRLAAPNRPSPWSYDQVEQTRPVIRQQRAQRVMVAPQPEYVVVDEWDSPMPVSNGISHRRPVFEIEDDYEYVPAPTKKPVLSQTIVSRLDEKPQMSFAQGYKILVCNLHQTVTLEDVEELFGNIGPLSSVQMTGTGMAEVVFLKKEDAYKAIEVYHYRLLDGQPMNVSVVGSTTKRIPNVPQPQQRSQMKMVYSPPQYEPMQQRPVTKSVLRSASGGRVRLNVARRQPEQQIRSRPQIYSSGGFF